MSPTRSEGAPAGPGGTAGRGVTPRPPDPEALLELPFHRVVMEWPETLPVLRDHGVDLRRDGGRPILDSSEAGALARAVFQATAWRPR